MSESTPPKVSVCIPTYNYGRFIADAIDSVLAQSFADFELIVVDNCSTDDTGRIVASFIGRDSRVSYHRNDMNIGMVPNWNRCLEYAKGEFVKILCADDLLAPTCLERSVQVMEENPAVVLVTTAREFFNNTVSSVVGYGDRDMVVDGTEAITHCLQHGNLGEPSAVLFRSAGLQRQFSADYLQAADMEMWFSLLEGGAMGYLHEPLTKIRLHPDQTTHENTRTLAIVEDELRLQETYERYVQYGVWERWRRGFDRSCYLWQRRNDYPEGVIESKIDRIMPMGLFRVLLRLRHLKNSLRRS